MIYEGSLFFVFECGWFNCVLYFSYFIYTEERPRLSPSETDDGTFIMFSFS